MTGNEQNWTLKNKKAPEEGAFRGVSETVQNGLERNLGGVDGTRTRNPRRDSTNDLKSAAITCRLNPRQPGESPQWPSVDDHPAGSLANLRIS